MHGDNLSTKEGIQAAQSGDLVLLIGRDHKTFILRLRSGAKFNTHRGTIAHDDLIDTPWGAWGSTHLDYPLVLFRPSADDLTQIVYPRNVAYIRNRLRPWDRIIPHTGYLVFARTLMSSEE